MNLKAGDGFGTLHEGGGGLLSFSSDSGSRGMGRRVGTRSSEQPVLVAVPAVLAVAGDTGANVDILIFGIWSLGVSS